MPGPADSWYHEKESAWLYAVVAAAERDPGRRDLFERLSRSAEEQAAHWSAGRPTQPPYAPTLRARIVALLVRRLGPRRLRHVLAAMKLRGVSVYGARLQSPPPHAAAVGHPRENHAATNGGNLRAAVFGVSDGLVSNAALVMGVAAAGMDSATVRITGLAGMVAGALSMAAGEYVSVRSQREFFEHQMALERAELAEYPDAEAEELAQIYHARGLDLADARHMSAALIKHPEQALDVLAREELGLNPDDLGSPWGAAGSSFVSFASGALIPLLPFFAGFGGQNAVVAAGAVTLVMLFAVGIVLSLFTGRHAVRGGLRMMLIGGGAGVAAWSIGKLVGAGIS